jgi:hypothetical protein
MGEPELESYEPVHLKLVGLVQQVLSASPKPESDSLPRPSIETLRRYKTPLSEWTRATTSWLANVNATLQEQVGEPLGLGQTGALLEMVRKLRRDFRDHVFATKGTLGSLAAETQEGAALRSKNFDDDYRQLLAVLEPYHELLKVFRSTPWGGATNPTDIAAGIQLRHSGANTLIDEFQEFERKARVLLEELLSAID